MGNTYINIAVKGASPELLRQTLSAQLFPSVIAPDVGGHSFVYADFFGSGDMQAPSRIAKSLSSQMGVDYAVFCMNADDDLFFYEFWSKGARVDVYFSDPTGFQPDEIDSECPRGDTVRLKSLFPFLEEQEIRRVLDSEDYTFEYERHIELFHLLGIPAGPAIMDFQYIQNGEIPEDVDEERLIRIER